MNWSVNIILERSLSKLYLMVCTFVQPAFNYSPQAPQLSVRHRWKTPLGIKWRRPSSKIRDFCGSDIFSTALLLCSKLQLESLFGKDHLTGREMISAHIRHPRPRQIANQILSPLGPTSNILTLFYRNTILALGSFLDTFQKIADSATNTRGATREIGACLTRIVIRHKAMEARMKTLSSALLDCLVLPLAEKMEEWRKVCPIFCPPRHLTWQLTMVLSGCGQP